MNLAKNSIVVWCFWILFAASVSAQEQTANDFKKYVDDKTNGAWSEELLEEMVKLVDKDGDGKISKAEFSNRMQAFREIAAKANRASGNRGKDKPGADSPGNSANEQGAENSDDKNATGVPPLDTKSDGPVLLITSNQLAKSWIPFAEWKNRNGKLTKIVTVGQITNHYKADNIQEKIRLCVQDHIKNHHTRWVILGGDCLPNGKGEVPGGHTTVHAQENKGIPTDIVYLSKTNWDADGDGIYGEFEDDRDAITYPDGSVGLGRIPMRTRKDVAAFTAKVIAYESNYPTTDFARQMIYTCTDSPAYPKVRNSWDGYVSKAWNGEVARFFSKETPWDEKDKPGSYPLSAENLVQLFNQKTIGKLHVHGHGHLPAWVLEKSTFTGKHVQQLKNDGAYPLITTVSCNTGEFDSRKDPSIVEHLLRVPNAGSVAVVAPVRTGKAHFGKRSDFRLMVSEGKLDGTTLTMTRYWAFGLGEGLTTGEALMRAKQAMIDDAKKSASYHLCICELNLLGDPTLDMRSEVPRKPSVEIEIVQGGTRPKVKIKTDAPGSTVCLTIDKDSSYVVHADDTGTAEFIVKKITTDSEVTVSGRNLNTVSKKLPR